MRLRGLLCRIEICNVRENRGENALRVWPIVGLKYPDQPFCGVGHDVAMNDLASQLVRVNMVPDLGDDDGAVHVADRCQNVWGHHREAFYIEVEQLAGWNRAAVTLGRGNRTDEGAELAVAPMISAGEMRALAVEDRTARIYHHAVGSGMKCENFTSHKNGFLKQRSE